MATRSKDTTDDASPLAEAVEKVLSNVVVSTYPVVITGVNRKVNIGNFENIDVYSGVAIPVTGEAVTPELIEKIQELVELGIKITSQETFKRYTAIKSML